jgi:hypothetical protein
MQKARQERTGTRLKLVRLAEEIGGVQTEVGHPPKWAASAGKWAGNKAASRKPRGLIVLISAWLVAKGFSRILLLAILEPFGIWAWSSAILFDFSLAEAPA